MNFLFFIFYFASLLNFNTLNTQQKISLNLQKIFEHTKKHSFFFKLVRIITRWEIQNKSIVLRAPRCKFFPNISNSHFFLNCQFFCETNKILQLIEISFGSGKAEIVKENFFAKKCWVAFLIINWIKITSKVKNEERRSLNYKKAPMGKTI